MKIVSAQQMAEIDRRTIEEYGIPAAILMENAGIRCREAIKELYPEAGSSGHPMTICAGKGNNGGDALVIARQVFAEAADELSVVYTYKEDEASENHRICEKLGLHMISWNTKPESAKAAIAGAELIVDGLTGTGIKGELRSPVKEIVQRVNDSDAVVVSVDVPSGVGGEFRREYTCIHADHTLTIGLPKTFLYLPFARPHCGSIRVLQIGFPRELLSDGSLDGDFDDEERLPSLLPRFTGEVYKNKRGTVAVFGGAPGLSGAPAMAAEAAGRNRAGLVTVFADERIYSALAAKLTSIMVRPWDSSEAPESIDLSAFDALVAGPGWGTEAGRLPWLEYLLQSGKPGILDADGLNLCAGLLRGSSDFRFPGGWVVTPHPGEFSRLVNRPAEEILADPLPFLLDFAGERGAVTVLKGHIIFIASPDGRFWITDGMNPAMATGGSGDVLSGLIGAFLAQGLPAADAARAGVLLHQKTGRRLFEEKGWFLAEDLLAALSAHIREAESR